MAEQRSESESGLKYTVRCGFESHLLHHTSSRAALAWPVEYGGPFADRGVNRCE